MANVDIARSPEELSALSGLVHDAWFGLDALAFDVEKAEATLPLLVGDESLGRLGWIKSQFGGPSLGSLIVRQVHGLDCHDEAKVGAYQVDYLAAAQSGRVVELHSAIPLRIDFHVESLHVECVRAFGCDYCGNEANRVDGRLHQIASDLERSVILQKCPKCGALYENTARGDDTLRLSDAGAVGRFPGFQG